MEEGQGKIFSSSLNWQKVASLTWRQLFQASVNLTKLYKYINLDEVYVHDAEAYTYDNEVLKKAEAMGKLGLVEIHAKEDSFIFTIESTDAIKASQLVFNAIEVLKQKLDAVRLSADMMEADEQFGELGAHMRGG